MNVLIFGATGMVGQGALHECLAASDVRRVLVVGRTPVAHTHPKLQQLTLQDLLSLASSDRQLQGFDACLYCLGVSSSGMTEEAYRRSTHELTMHVASVLAKLNPEMTFIYVSGAGADSSERGSSMWARVKGKTENDLKRLPFRSVYLFRPAVIQPLRGIQSKTASYRTFYRLANPFLSLLRSISPDMVLTIDDIGRAMLQAVRESAGRVVVERKGIARLARASVLGTTLQ